MAEVPRGQRGARQPMAFDERAPCPVHADFDPLSSAFLADPFAVLNALPSEHRVFYAPSIDYDVVTRYADIEAVFLDPEAWLAASGRDTAVFPEPEKFDMGTDERDEGARVRQRDPLLPGRRTGQARSGDRTRGIDAPLSSSAARRRTAALVPREHLLSGSASPLGVLGPMNSRTSSEVMVHPAGRLTSECRRCRAALRWARTNGGASPVAPDPARSAATR